MTCPAGFFHGHAGYTPNGRVIACRKCGGRGVFEPVQPERPAPPVTIHDLLP